MSHFEIGDWVDFVRGLITGPERDAMSAHLRTGCAECAETCRWLQTVATLASSSPTVKVPERLVRRAESIFEPPPLFRFDSLFPLMANLIFDAGQAAQPVGVRSAGAVDHKLYEAGGFSIDLHQERDLRQESGRGSARISLTGQISALSAFHEDSPRFPVALFSGNSIISNAVTNRFGEFSLTYPRRPALKLAIAILDTGRKIEIPLTRVARKPDYKPKEE